MPAHLVWILLIVFWAPDASRVKTQTTDYQTIEACDAAAAELDSSWSAAVHGGSTSWACFGVYPDPTE